MKKIFILLITSIIILSSCVSVYASEDVSFTMTDCECDNNRLFTVDIIAESDSKFSAATFEFTYDKSMFEFREAKVSDDNARITTNETNNTLKAVYLNALGKDISSKSTIFTLKFKAIDSGVGYIDFNVSDCVNSDAEFIDIGNCSSAKVTVSGKSTDSNEESESSDKGKDSKNSKKSNKKENETTTPSTVDDLGFLNSINDKSTRFLLIGMCVGASAIVLVVMGYFILQKIKSKFKKKDILNQNKNDDSTTK